MTNTIQPEPMNVIYGLSCMCHPEKGIRYVGQTRRGIHLRLRMHFNSARTESERRYPVYNWIRKHGEESVHAEILEVTSDPALLNDLERKWIAALSTYGGEGLNLTDGGRAMSGYKHTPETRARLSAIHTGRTRTEFHRKRIADISIGSQNRLAKLTESDVQDIKMRLWLGETGAHLAREYGVTAATIAYINTGQTWTHVDWPIGPRRRPQGGSPRRAGAESLSLAS